MTADQEVADRYGPWAVIVGASNGVGEAYARLVAELGINVVLLARRQNLLDEVAGAISADFGVETRVLSVDLTSANAADDILGVTADLDVGTLMYCAGAESEVRGFFSISLDHARGLVHRNCVVPLELCHHFGPRMAERGSGAIVLVSSAAGLHGMANMVTYAGTKAFDILFAEALWAELHGTGVDVLCPVLGATDTPAYREVLAEAGVLSSPEDTAPIPGAVSSEETAAEIIANLGNGPVWPVSQVLRDRLDQLGRMDRNEATRVLLSAVSPTPEEP